TDQAVFLLDNLWDAMISNENYRSGASWEYVAQSMEPGNDLFTSLSHPWGGAPTYAFTNYVAGIRPVEFGFRRWIVNPLVSGLNVTSANATVNTPYGDLSAAWELVDSQLSVTITAPVGTDGTFEVAQPSSSTGIYETHIAGIGEAITISVQLLVEDSRLAIDVCDTALSMDIREQFVLFSNIACAIGHKYM
ncbi:hypothetical protein F441_01059, partial [Phytophthora nicotianae CJ01A1]